MCIFLHAMPMVILPPSRNFTPVGSFWMTQEGQGDQKKRH